MKHPLFAGLLLLTLPLSGCTIWIGPDIFDRPKTTKAQFSQDYDACKTLGKTSTRSSDPDVQRLAVRRCMKSKGYRVKH